MHQYHHPHPRTRQIPSRSLIYENLYSPHGPPRRAHHHAKMLHTRSKELEGIVPYGNGILGHLFLRTPCRLLGGLPREVHLLVFRVLFLVDALPQMSDIAHQISRSLRLPTMPGQKDFGKMGIKTDMLNLTGQ